MVINSAINSRMHILTLSSSLVASDSSLQQSKGRPDLTHHETCDKHRVQVNPAPDKQWILHFLNLAPSVLKPT